MNAEKRHFLGFDGVRALAAFVVIIHHNELFKSKIGMTHNFNTVIDSLGWGGVDLFFVLSGFLITYLFFEESRNTGRISTLAFYKRRVFRILPLYFLLVLMAFSPFVDMFIYFGGKVGYYVYNLLADRDHFLIPNLALHLAMLPNIAVFLFPPVLFASHLWSIGVEEQFYLIWPWLAKVKRVPFEAIIILILLVKFFISHVLDYTPDGSLISVILYEFPRTFRVECMALGALAATILFKHEDKLKPLANLKSLHFVAPLIFILTICFRREIPFNTFVAGALNAFALLIVQQRRHILLDHPVMGYLGKISYGTYMFHSVVILLVLGLLTPIQYESYFGPLTILLSVLGTYLVSALSFKYFEAFFMRLKNRY